MINSVILFTKKILLINYKLILNLFKLLSKISLNLRIIEKKVINKLK